MSESLDERLAAARAARKEKEWVAHRLVEAQGDRSRLAAQLEVAAQLVSLASDKKERASAKAHHDGMKEELHAIEADLAQLTQRAATVAGAEAQYQAVLAEVERARGAGEFGEDLQLIAETDGKLRAARRELAEAIAAGRAAHDALVAVKQGASRSSMAAYASDQGSSLLDDLGASLLTSTAVDLSEHAVHEGLRAELAAAQHAMLKFQRECKDVAGDAGIEGVNVTPMPGLAAMVVRDLVWNTQGALADIGAEADMLSSYVATTTMELRARDAELQRGQADMLEMRAAILDPQRERL
ncbi:MAG TPA: hypothetical protein VM261_18605 [Kofleriaceae bacterium]|nr:hypothetical protein [Kofleriaceae bacterium]